MKKCAALLCIFFQCAALPLFANEEGFIPLFNGTDFTGWKASENQASFTVEDGMIRVKGPRSHLFYQGDVANADFKNFVFRADVKTMPQANSGIFFHTKWQEKGWSSHGYEAQVNNTMKDPQKSGGLYNTVRINPSPVNDEEWFSYEIHVAGKNVRVLLNGKEVVNFDEPEGKEGTVRLSSGTFALQAHDPDSLVYFKNIRVKVLP